MTSFTPELATPSVTDVHTDTLPCLIYKDVSVVPGLLESLAGYSQQTETVLEVFLCPELNYEQVTALFDIVPGLDTCQYDRATGMYRTGV